MVLDYQYRKVITISHLQVGSAGAPHLNFPVLLSLTDPLLSYPGGFITSPNGYDIIFADQYNIQLDHEIESYNAATGAISMWVRIPSLSATQDTLIYIYFGNSSITTSQENVTGVWDGNTYRVLHLSASNYLKDSSALLTTATNNGTTQTSGGEVDGAANCASSGYISIPTMNLPVGAARWTIEAWGNMSSLPGTGNNPILLWLGTATADQAIALYWNGGNQNLALSLFSDVGGDILSGGIPSTNTWFYMAATFSGGTATLYVNGVAKGTKTPALNVTYGTCYIGAEVGPTNFWNFLADEVRISGETFGSDQLAARSSGWILTVYNGISSPSTFFSVGPLQVAPVGFSPALMQFAPTNLWVNIGGVY